MRCPLDAVLDNRLILAKPPGQAVLDTLANMSEITPVRLFHPGPIPSDQAVQLDAQTSHHAVRVLRLEPGARLELFNGDGLRHDARLLDTDPKGASVQVLGSRNAGTESRLSITLAQALPSGDKMDWVVEKAVELGVTAIWPLFSARSLLRLDAARAAKRLAHWQRIVVAASMQSGRDRLAQVLEPRELTSWLADTGDARQDDADTVRLVLSPHEGGRLDSLDARHRNVWLLVGPEGGFNEAELAAAKAHGWAALQLGPRVLRTETAGLAAIAALQTRWGDLS